MSERRLQKKCLQYARDRGCFARKTETPGHAGFPDSVIHYSGRTLYVEFKNPNGKGVLSPLQTVVINDLREHGMHVAIIDNPNDFHEAIRCIMIGDMPGSWRMSLPNPKQARISK